MYNVYKVKDHEWLYPEGIRYEIYCNEDGIWTVLGPATVITREQELIEEEL